MLEPATAAVTVPDVHVVDALGVAATVKPEGRLSISTAPVKAIELPFVTVTVSVDATPTFTAEELKAFEITGGVKTVSVAVVAVAFVTP